MNETQLTQRIKDYMVANGAYIEKIFGGGFQASGVPDLLACYKGRFVAIEVKTPNGKGVASDIQKIKIRMIRGSGGIAFFADSLDDVENVIQQIDNGNKVFTYSKDKKYFK